MTLFLHEWMWAHPNLFTIVVCVSFALFGVLFFLSIKKLVGKSDDYS